MVSASAIARQIERVDRRLPVKFNRGTKYFEETVPSKQPAVLRRLDQTPSSDLPSNHSSEQLFPETPFQSMAFSAYQFSVLLYHQQVQ